MNDASFSREQLLEQLALARRQAEEARQNTDEKYRQLFEAGADAIVLIDNLSGRILEANTAACSLYGYSREEILALNNTDLSAEPDDTHKVTTGTPVVRERVVSIPLRWHRKKDGTRVPVEITGRFFIHDGRPVHVAAIRDISRRLAAEDEKAKLQAQLLQSQKVESVGRLAGGVAHDFNNMLGVILGHTGLALEQAGDAHPLHNDLVEIQKAANRSADLTRQLLAFARRQTIMPRVLDLNETVEGMLNMLRRLIGEQITMEWSPGTGLPPVKIDPSQVSQVLVNLSVNARDAIDEVGTVTIATSAAEIDAAYCADHGEGVPGRYLLLTVNDTGCGMSPEMMVHLFEPFFTTKRVGQGTGLGLATVHGIVKQNGGFVTVDSVPGQGSTFRIYLPEYAGARTPQAADASKAAEPRGVETVLLVEDEPALVNVARRMLERLGYKVLAATSPTEAIKLAEGYPDPIHVIIADVVMPEMNGRDLASRISTLSPNIRRIFMSGYPADVMARDGLIEDGVYFLHKPFSSSALATIVREALRRN
jgi:two-component system cell cycle sensor histidine kinase/response regulator CckA